MGHSWMKSSRHPCQVATSLFTEVVNIYRALIPGGKNDYIAFSFRHKFDLQKMMNYKPYLNYVEATAELQRVWIYECINPNSWIFLHYQEKRVFPSLLTFLMHYLFMLSWFQEEMLKER
jgi:hypothetical protein